MFLSTDFIGSPQAPCVTCVQVLAYVSRVRDVTSSVDNSTFTLEDVEANDVRCPDSEAAKAMYKGERFFSRRCKLTHEAWDQTRFIAIKLRIRTHACW